MDYLVKGLARPGYYDVMYGRGICDPFEMKVSAPDKIQAREIVRKKVNHSFIKFASIDQVREVSESDNEQTIDLPDLEKPWWESSIVAYDVETTGTSVSDDRIVEIAFSHYGDREFEEPVSYLINDGKVIPPDSTDIHGITNEMIEDKSSFDEVFDEIYKKHLKGTALLIAHNRGFDHGFLLHSMARSGRSDYVPAVGCTMELGLQLDNGPDNNKLETLMEYFSVDGVNSHRAGDDCRGAGNLFLEFARMDGSFFRQKECSAIDVIRYFDQMMWPKDHVFYNNC